MRKDLFMISSNDFVLKKILEDYQDTHCECLECKKTYDLVSSLLEHLYHKIGFDKYLNDSDKQDFHFSSDFLLWHIQSEKN